MTTAKGRQCTEQSFLRDVLDHQMTVLRDDGVYRHVRFKKPNSGCMHFDLMTWPGWLCYSGDMGSDLRLEVEARVLCNADECEQVAKGSALGFEHDGDLVFQDFWEVDLTEYTHRFIWCCYAIAWGIQQYDNKDKPVSRETHS